MNKPKDQIEKFSKVSRKKRYYIIAIFGAGIVLSLVIYFILGNGIAGLFPGKSFHRRPLNVILVTLDTLRADYLSCYKEGNASTPHLDRLAEEGILFERCIAQAPLTLPSHVTILSGTYPLHHRVRDNGGFRVPQQLELVSEVLQQNGFITSAFIAAYVLHSKWGINQGFDTYSDAFDLARYRSKGLEVEKPAGVVLKDAMHWIKENKDNKFFTWIHLFDPHAPYTPLPPYDKKYPDNPYAGEVAYVDEQLGFFFKFLKDQGLYEKSIIVVTADHGEGLWEHEERTHGYFVYESTIWAPLIIRVPGEFPGKRIPALVEHVDIAPTMLDLLGIPIPGSYQGESLLPLMLGKGVIEKEVAYTESFYPRLHLAWSELQALYHREWKYIRAPKQELYNLNNDRNEKNNEASKQTSIKENINRKLLKFIREKSKQAIPVQTLQPDKEDRKRLESLGYITSSAAKSTGEPLPDPKDKLRFLQVYEEVKTLMEEKKYKQVIQITGKLLEEEPNNVDTLNLRGAAYLKNGLPQEAARHFYRVLKERPDYNDAMINLVQSLITAGQLEQAIREARRFLKMFPQDHTLYTMLGDALFFEKDYEQALEHLEKAVNLESSDSMALRRIGDIYFIKKDYKTAESYFKKALAVFPQLENANLGLALVKEAENDLNQAKEYYKKELENNPSNRFAVFNLAEALKKTGAYDKAIPFYQRAIEIDPMFKLPYFMIARYYLETGQNLQEAIKLCKTAIRIEPANEVTLLGYFILTNLYAKLGDRENTQFYTREGEKLYQALEKQKGKR